MDQHRAIIQAVKEHHPVDAHRLMLHHLRSRYTLPTESVSAQPAQDSD
jgi:DNA-binding GntR family transcriptional regulator